MKSKLASLKETRLFVALALLVQSFTFFVMFIILCAKKKSIAAAFLAVSAMEGGTAAYLLYQLKEETGAEFDAVKEALEREEEDDAFDEAAISADLSCFDDEAEVIAPRAEILREESVSEEEFQ